MIALKYRLFPSKTQQKKLKSTLEACRLLYNRSLEQRKTLWENEKKTISCYDQQKELAASKDLSPSLSQVHSQVLQDAIHRLDRAFRAFFRRIKSGETPGYPRFKGKGWYTSFTYPQSGFLLTGDSVRLSKIGTIKAKIHRHVSGKIKTCTVICTRGKWYACFTVDKPELKPRPEPAEESTGIDLGLKTFATLSNGDQIDNPRFFRQEEKALAKASRLLSKEEKGTPARAKRRKVVARIHERIKNRRHNFIHQESSKIVNKFQTICIEDLKTEQIKHLPTASRGMRKSIQDASWTQFRQVLTAKAESAGRRIIAVNPAYTSQDCHQCGYRAKKALKDRWHLCPICGASLDRDHNAALNILGLGIQSLSRKRLEAQPLVG